MIDIIIPMYNCIDTIESTLLSISTQIIKNKLNVILVDDCSNQSYENIIEKFRPILSIKYIKHDKNMGAGVSRQTGVDNSNSEYIIFMDSDDLFYTATSTQELYDNICLGYDYVESLVYNEQTNDKYSSTSDLHGKIYKREFIEKNNIKFNNTRYHEDNSFNNIIIMNNPNKKSIDIETYIYCNNNKSLTKNINEENLDNLELYIENIKYVIDNTSHCSKNLIDNYLNTKVIYLNNIIKNKQLDTLDIKKLLNKYKLDNLLNLGIN